jgi:type IV secretory pathway VirB10-like protein
MSIENSNHTAPINLDDEPEVVIETPATTPEAAAPTKLPENPAAARIQEFATRANLTGKEGIDKRKLVLLAGGLVIAVAFFIFSQFQSKPVRKHPVAEQKQQQNTTTKSQPSSSTPMMDPVLPKNNDPDGDHINASDIARTKKPDYSRASTAQTASTGGGKSLNAVPPFKDTQQKWEDPAPYGNQQQPQNTAAAQQAANALKEASLVYVRAPQQSSNGHTDASPEDNTPALQLKEGTRIEARLETQISSDIHAPVVAVVENTYAIGDQVLVPAGARIYGRLAQADAQGNVGVDFNEIDLLDGSREKMEAIGTSLDMGPIKGEVYGKHNGRNFLIRSMSGIASTAAMLIGNNVNGAYSESDMIRERAADNLGMAGDSQLMQLNSGSRLTVSVPANTKIYVVWTQHAKESEKVARASAAP